MSLKGRLLASQSESTPCAYSRELQISRFPLVFLLMRLSLPIIENAQRYRNHYSFVGSIALKIGNFAQLVSITNGWTNNRLLSGRIEKPKRNHDWNKNNEHFSQYGYQPDRI
jgi:hypothetical protein